METNFELFDICVKTLAENSETGWKIGWAICGIISKNEACISIIHNFLKSNVLDEKRRNNLKSVLFQYAIKDLSINGIWEDYKHDNKCPDMTKEDYIKSIFIKNDRYSVKNAYSGNDAYDIWLATLGLLREMMTLLS
jgi:hypothetical protein